MVMVRGWWRRLHMLDVGGRRAATMAILSGALLVALIAVWLALSTRTALLNQQLDELDARHARLTAEINQTWTEIGEVTSPRTMEVRARRLGFRPAERIEYLVVALDATPEAAATRAAGE